MAGYPKSKKVAMAKASRSNAHAEIANEILAGVILANEKKRFKKDK
ncbi:MAG: hypothetical protein FWF59_15000 [Turicibacter sp.]|nr:hypothetical protein [Turicibacter sp.]